jgi:hypothetical protein
MQWGVPSGAVSHHSVAPQMAHGSRRVTRRQEGSATMPHPFAPCRMQRGQSGASVLTPAVSLGFGHSSQAALTG